MKKDILFSEKQRFNQWWLWLIVAGVNALVVFDLVQKLSSRAAGGPPVHPGVFAGCGLVILINALLVFIRLDTVIKEDGLYTRFFPFQRRFRHFSWESIGQIRLRQYSPLGEFGGWGLRFGTGGGKAYTISGNKGIQLFLNDGSRLLIGTSRYDEVERVLEKLKR